MCVCVERLAYLKDDDINIIIKTINIHLFSQHVVVLQVVVAVAVAAVVVAVVRRALNGAPRTIIKILSGKHTVLYMHMSRLC